MCPSWQSAHAPGAAHTHTQKRTPTATNIAHNTFTHTIYECMLTWAVDARYSTAQKHSLTHAHTLKYRLKRTIHTQIFT